MDVKPCPAGHVIQDFEDFVYPINRERNLWSACCDHPDCTWSTIGFTEEDAIEQWNKQINKKQEEK